MAPIVRVGEEGERELDMARWGMPGPPQFGGQPVTNIRNVKSPHWRRWLGKGSRCIVPATSFCEYEDTKPRKTPIWFALAEDTPLFAFRNSGVSGDRKPTRTAATAIKGYLSQRDKPLSDRWSGRSIQSKLKGQPDLTHDSHIDGPESTYCCRCRTRPWTPELGG